MFMQGDNQPTQYNACFTAIVTVKYVPFPVTPNVYLAQNMF